MDIRIISPAISYFQWTTDFKIERPAIISSTGDCPRAQVEYEKRFGNAYISIVEQKPDEFMRT